MEIKKEMSIKKILVKCPPHYEESFLLFPFLIALSEEFPKSEIFLICEEGTALAFAFLPFKVRAFERPKEKMGLFETHHFCANLNDVFNIDLFFDLENTINSSFIGFNFRANERVGYSTGWNKYFLTKSFNVLGDKNLERSTIHLLELYLNKNLEGLKISRVKSEGDKIDTIEQLFMNSIPPKFILIMLDDFQKVVSQVQLWTKFFDSFEKQKFIIYSLKDEDLISELFTKIDLGHNELYMHKSGNPKELIYLFDKVAGVVANNKWSESLCTYYGVNIVSFIFDHLEVLPVYRNFVFSPQRVDFSDPGKILIQVDDEIREVKEINEVVDHLHFYFKL